MDSNNKGRCTRVKRDTRIGYVRYLSKVNKFDSRSWNRSVYGEFRCLSCQLLLLSIPLSSRLMIALVECARHDKSACACVKSTVGYRWPKRNRTLFKDHRISFFFFYMYIRMAI